jgi:hypothetical protein
MTEPKPRTGDDRDPWLAAALRHAPDAADAPPPAVSEAILRAAHERAAAARAPSDKLSSPGPLWQLWSWLTQPAVATAFATLVIATAIGVMWRDEALEPRITRPAPPPVPAITQTPDAAAPAPPSSPAAESTAVPAAAPNAVPAAAQQEARRDVSEREGRSPPARPSPAAEAAKLAPRQEAQAQPPAEKTTPDRASTAARSDAPAGVAPSTPAAAGPMRARSAEPAAASGERAAAINAPAALFAAVREQPQRWRWQADGGAMRAVDAQFLRWWAELERAASTWSARAPAAGNPGAAPALVLRAIDSASVAVTIRLEADSAQAQFASGAAWHATLSGADAEALRQTLEQLAR